MGYSANEAARAAQAQAGKHKEEAERLRRLIVDHYKKVHSGDWGADDELWEGIGLVADPGVIG